MKTTPSVYTAEEKSWAKVSESNYILSTKDLLNRMAEEDSENCIFKSADLIIDSYQGLVYKGGTRIFMRNVECNILTAFLVCPRVTLARSVLLDIISRVSRRPLMDNTLSVHLARLRRTLRQSGSDVYIETHNMFGYIWKYPVYKIKRENVDLTELVFKPGRRKLAAE